MCSIGKLRGGHGFMDPTNRGHPLHLPAPSSKDSAVASVLAPLEGYNAPLESYNAPLEGYNAPLESYNAPLEGYNDPLESYNAPLEGYNAPLESYNAPLESYTFQLLPVKILQLLPLHHFRVARVGNRTCTFLLQGGTHS